MQQFGIITTYGVVFSCNSTGCRVRLAKAGYRITRILSQILPYYETIVIHSVKHS